MASVADETRAPGDSCGCREALQTAFATEDIDVGVAVCASPGCRIGRHWVFFATFRAWEEDVGLPFGGCRVIGHCGILAFSVFSVVDLDLCCRALVSESVDTEHKFLPRVQHQSTSVPEPGTPRGIYE